MAGWYLPRPCSETPGTAVKGRGNGRGLCTLNVCVFGFGYRLSATAKRMVREGVVGTGPLGSQDALCSHLPGFRESANPEHLTASGLSDLLLQLCQPWQGSRIRAQLIRVWGSSRFLATGILTCRRRTSFPWGPRSCPSQVPELTGISVSRHRMSKEDPGTSGSEVPTNTSLGLLRMKWRV